MCGHGLARRTVLFALPDLVLIVLMVGDQTAAGTHASTDQRTFSAPKKAADQGATRGGAADDLGFRVVPGIVVMLLAFRAAI